MLILECTESWGSPIDAHNRNSLALVHDLKCDLVCGTCEDGMRTSIPESYLYCLRKKYNALAFSYASHYINYIHYPKFVNANPKAQIFWIVNEYNLTHPFSFLKKMGIPLSEIVLITNVEKDERAKDYKRSILLNLNLLLARTPNHITQKKYGIVYYGTFRTDRVKYFKRYLQEGVVVSSSKKNLAKWKGIGCKARFVDKFQWPNKQETLNNFKFSLYIEDEFTHRNYNFLANRFYEALFCNCVLMFDRSCANTLKRSQLEVPEDFLVSTHKELMDKTKSLEKDLSAALKVQQGWLDGVLAQRQQLLSDISAVFHAEY